MKTGTGGGTGQTTETSVGASVKLAPELPLEEAPINIGPSFTYEWEKATSLEQKTTTEGVDGNKFITHVPWQFGEEEAYFNAVGFVETVYWCYDYTEASYGLMTVWVPRPEAELTALNASLEWWYGDGADQGRATYPDSGCQSASTWPRDAPSRSRASATAGTPNLAVDGKTDGNYYNGSVQHTAYEALSWWQVDLGGPQAIDARSSSGIAPTVAPTASPTSMFLCRNTPSPAPSRLSLINARCVELPRTRPGRTPHGVVPVGHEGRYVRVQLAGTNYCTWPKCRSSACRVQ